MEGSLSGVSNFTWIGVIFLNHRIRTKVFD
jgi:hypothetical protein